MRLLAFIKLVQKKMMNFFFLFGNFKIFVIKKTSKIVIYIDLYTKNGRPLQVLGNIDYSKSGKIIGLYSTIWREKNRIFNILFISTLWHKIVLQFLIFYRTSNWLYQYSCKILNSAK